jgi:Protein of unknown function (DUF2795)
MVRSLVDKSLKIWLVVAGVAFEISYDESNSVLYYNIKIIQTEQLCYHIILASHLIMLHPSTAEAQGTVSKLRVSNHFKECCPSKYNLEGLERESNSDFSCGLCKNEYPDQRELFEHLRLDHKIFTYEEQKKLMVRSDQRPAESSETTKYICKVCGSGYEERSMFDAHVTGAHHPKRTITAHDIINGLFNGSLNYPKTKAELLREANMHKDKRPGITPEIIQTLENLPDKRYNDEAELTHAIQSARVL